MVRFHRQFLIKITHMEKFARTCSITGKGMNEGYCFGDGEEYAIDEQSALILAKRYGYETLEEAYEDEVYYYTEWEEDDEEDDEEVN